MAGRAPPARGHLTASALSKDLPAPSAERLAAAVRALERFTRPIAETLTRFEAAAAEVAARRGVTVDVEPIIREQPLRLDAEMVAHATAAAEAVGAPYQRLVSGASHDANHVALLCPIGRLFIPCRDGRSHCPEERAEAEHLAAGTRVLLELVPRLDAALRGA